MPKFSALLVSCLAVLPFVTAHGFVSQVVVNGKTYKGNVPNNPTGDSPIRLINDVSPVKGASNKDLNCGHSAQLAALVADADAGSNMTFSWQSGDTTSPNWPHNTGPMITYMASCGNTTCDKFNSSHAQWFKIHEVGKKSDGKTWVQQDIMNGGSLSVPLPKNLTAGGYIVRHEIIALHLATSEGGAEFYPSCTQINLSGTGSGQPNSTVSFPGAYSDTDPGIFDPTVFNPGAAYTFPGPAVQTFATSTSSSSSSSSPSPSPSPIANAAATPSASASSGHCRSSNNMPRSFSRVMRRIMN